MSTSKRGFTLLELMIVVAVIALLAAIALPSFFAQIRHSRRSDAIAQINTVALAEEQWRTNCPSFAQYAAAPCVVTVPAGPNFMSKPAATSYYTYNDIGNISASSYTITATAAGSQTKDRQFGTACSALTYAMNAGVITKTPAACWGQ